MTFDDFEFKIGQLVRHRGGNSGTATVPLVVVERAMRETVTGIAQWYTIATEGYTDVEVRAIEIIEYVRPVR